jgi:hypothetical protein
MISPHLLGSAGATAVVILCTVLPFLPGRHDTLAVPLSAMAEMVGTAGLITVPFGAFVLVAERSSRLGRWRAVLTVLMAVFAALAWSLVAVTAMVHSGFALGIAVLTLGVYIGLRAWPVLPLYLATVPLAAAAFQFAFVDQAVEASRNRAMRNAAPLIAAIERHRAEHGRYPPSLLASWGDFAPGVIGIERYYYEPHFDAYNLVFEQFTYRLGTDEYLVYNPRDEQVFTAHAVDILELTPAQLALERTRGHYEEGPASQPHWKYFRFD